MKHPNLKTLAAAIATGALFATGAWAQSTTSSGSSATTSPSTTTTSPSTTTTSPSTTGATSSGLTTGTSDPSRYDSSNTHLKPECFDRVTGTWRTTGDCASSQSAIPGSSAAGGTGSSLSNMDSTSPANPMPVTPSTPSTPLTTPSGAAPGSSSDVNSGTGTSSSTGTSR